MKNPTSQTYVVRVEFDAPLDFVFRWCTDLHPKTPNLRATPPHDG